MKLAELEDALQREGQRLPNLTHPDVPVGGEEVATLLREVGAQPRFAFPVKDHLQLGEELDLIDFEAGALVAGTKFYYLKREAALLELALVNFTMQRVAAAGFMPMMTPDLVRESVLEKCGFQPRADNTQVGEGRARGGKEQGVGVRLIASRAENRLERIATGALACPPLTDL